MVSEGFQLAFSPEVARALASGRVTVLGASFFQACCHRAPITLTEAIDALAHHGMSEEEARAGCAEALLARVVRTDGSPFRPGDSAFYWPARRASD